MVSFKELRARVRKELRFNWQETSGIFVAMIVAGFIFSFRDWGGDSFNAALGLSHLIFMTIIAGITFFFRATCQKIYGLTEAHFPILKIWYVGLFISILIAFLTVGRVPIIFLGAMVTSFMVRHRLGEFRYGFSYWVNGVIALWGICANLILAIIFAIGLYFFPGSYVFTKGLHFNLIMAGASLLPIPYLDGFHIFFAKKSLYFFAIFLVLLGSVLLLTKTAFGLIFSIVVGLTVGAVYVLIGSEK